MFSLASKKFYPLLWLIVTSLALVWVVEGQAEGLFDQAEIIQTQNSLSPVALKTGSDLVKDGRAASEKQIPVLMFFSMEHCPYCMEVEEDYLKPLLRNAEYRGKVLIRKIRVDGINTVRDFKGEQRDAGELSDDYNVSMVPTLILVDSHGKQIAPAIIGIKNSHYYSAELDDAIDASIQKLRAIAKR